MKRIISTDKAPKAIGPYNQAIEFGNMLFLSGQIPLDPQGGELVANNIEAQTLQVFSNIKNVLEEANYTLDHVVKTTVFLSDLSNFAAMNKIYADFFTKDQPARSTVQVAALPKGALIEIECIAVK